MWKSIHRIAWCAVLVSGLAIITPAAKVLADTPQEPPSSFNPNNYNPNNYNPNSPINYNPNNYNPSN
jgi:hypothetical protein